MSVTQAPTAAPDPLVPYSGIEAATGWKPFHRNHLERLVKAGHFPAPIKLGHAPQSRICWRKSDLLKWIAEREAASKQFMAELVERIKREDAAEDAELAARVQS
jgi:predicted DNA-binding transcriptional regulator AlpA